MSRSLLCYVLLVSLSMMLRPASAAASTETILYSFNSGTDASDPSAALIFDSAGNLYGTCKTGGTHLQGAIFKLTPQQGGGWTETVLYNFTGGSDGSAPQGALVMDSAGNLFGTTSDAGVGFRGTIFELSPVGGGWQETTLHGFTGSGGDGSYPQGALTLDSAGNLYGVTLQGGTSNWGTVFELSPVVGGYSYQTLCNFSGGLDGKQPQAGLIFDGFGNLFGTTGLGGKANHGVVFELSTGVGGVWTQAVLYRFRAGNDGSEPVASVTFDPAGNLYGTTIAGGNTGCSGLGCGTVFELSPDGTGGWNEKVIHRFTGGTSGATPYANVIFDASGNLYGTTQQGGGSNGGGTVFALLPNGSDGWSARGLHRFSAFLGDGYSLFGGLILDGVGNLYGTSQGGGSSGFGTVFEITP